jgi:hypothetical protein
MITDRTFSRRYLSIIGGGGLDRKHEDLDTVVRSGIYYFWLFDSETSSRMACQAEKAQFEK